LWFSLLVGFSLATVDMYCGWGDLGGEAYKTEASRTSLRTLATSSTIFCARSAIRYKPAAKKTVVRANTPAAENNPSLML